MATKTITFDPTSGVAYGLNLTMYGGSDFEVTLNVKTTSSGAFSFHSPFSCSIFFYIYIYISHFSFYLLWFPFSHHILSHFLKKIFKK